MHIQHADRNSAAFTSGCGRHSGSDATFSLRRRALLEVAAAATAQAPATPVESGKPVGPTASVSAPRAADGSTYDVSAMRREKGSVSILTQDGDTVKIRFRNTVGIAVEADNSSTADASTSSTSIYGFASGRMQVEVNGELDADELKAIGDLMQKVDSLATQFFDGDTQAAFTAASDLGFNAGEIAGFALRLSVKESVRATIQAPVAAATPSPAPAQSTPMPDPVPVASDPAPTQVDPPASVTPNAPAEIPTAAPAVAEAPATDPAQAAPAAQPASTTDPAASLQQKLGSFLSQVLDALSGVNGAGRAEFSMKWKLQVMISAVQSAPAATATDPAGTRLATDSLQGLASAQT